MPTDSSKEKEIFSILVMMFQETDFLPKNSVCVFVCLCVLKRYSSFKMSASNVELGIKCGSASLPPGEGYWDKPGCET